MGLQDLQAGPYLISLQVVWWKNFAELKPATNQQNICMFNLFIRGISKIVWEEHQLKNNQISIVNIEQPRLHQVC